MLNTQLGQLNLQDVNMGVFEANNIALNQTYQLSHKATIYRS
ncbi:hypothetical protein SAMN05216464_102217 [Mucilaginibacter pineti]|uniref:Uncharacterized protein n=1 Tax=Mucilaginibacter pineti TaxID=1391627 RepID=A0A1G6WKG4_9SPHI|nr:hypothetical protein SAMN05216464_102217 [Mucilaginibacter pineti]